MLRQSLPRSLLGKSRGDMRSNRYEPTRETMAGDIKGKQDEAGSCKTQREEAWLDGPDARHTYVRYARTGEQDPMYHDLRNSSRKPSFDTPQSEPVPLYVFHELINLLLRLNAMLCSRSISIQSAPLKSHAVLSQPPLPVSAHINQQSPSH